MKEWNLADEHGNKTETAKKLILPDFSNSIVNISATLAEFLGAPNRNAILPSLKEELCKEYQNIVFLCFDGLGMYPLRKNLDKTDFLFQNLRQILLSTFPSIGPGAFLSGKRAGIFQQSACVPFSASRRRAFRAFFMVRVRMRARFPVRCRGMS